jgi:ubiquinone biosynthesis protein Coq4
MSDIKYKDRKSALKAVKEDGSELEYVAPNLRADREVVLEAVKNWGFALQYASDNFKADREVVLEAIKNDSDALRYASESLQNDPELKKIVESRRTQKETGRELSRGNCAGSQ